jgi:hypothetical protein
MTKIIGFFGAKESGKNTCANIIHGLELMKLGMIKDYRLDDKGKLFILTENSVGEDGWGELDVTRRDPEFVNWAHNNMWPHIKIYSYATDLKNLAINLFNVPEECVYGTNEQKNTVMEHLLWENMPGVITPEKVKEVPLYYKDEWGFKEFCDEIPSLGLILHDSGPMTAREFMQFLGTEIGRKMWGPVWINSTIKKIKSEASNIAIISDVRYEDEVDAVNEAGGYVVGLGRKPHKDSHSSEPDVKKFDKSKMHKLIANHKQTYNLENLIEDVKAVYTSVC